MSAATKADSRNVPVTSAAEVHHLLGPLNDNTVAQILRLNPSLEDLEVAARHVQGEGDLADRVGHPLTGRAAKIYEILSAEEEDTEEIERRA